MGKYDDGGMTSQCERWESDGGGMTSQCEKWESVMVVV